MLANLELVPLVKNQEPSKNQFVFPQAREAPWSQIINTFPLWVFKNASHKVLVGVIGHHNPAHQPLTFGVFGSRPATWQCWS